MPMRWRKCSFCATIWPPWRGRLSIACRPSWMRPPMRTRFINSVSRLIRRLRRPWPRRVDPRSRTPWRQLRPTTGSRWCRSWHLLPIAPVVAAGAEVSGRPEHVILLRPTYRGGDFVNQALVFEQHDFGLAVGIVVVLPAAGRYVVLQHAGAPHRVVDLFGAGGDGIRPDLVHRRVALVEMSPLIGLDVEAAAAGCRGHPNRVALHGHAVHHIVWQAAVELVVGVESSRREAAKPAHGGRPDIASARVRINEQYGAMRQPVLRAVHFPLPVLVQGQAIFGGRPHTGAIHLDLKHVVVRQAVFRGEVLPTVPRHLGSACPCSGRANDEYRNPCIHKVFRYSIRSFNSSLVRSLVTPCRSCGLNTVQISSKVWAEPSCR